MSRIDRCFFLCIYHLNEVCHYCLMLSAALSNLRYIGVRMYWYQGMLNMQLRKQKSVSEMEPANRRAVSVFPPKAPTRSPKQTAPMAKDIKQSRIMRE